MHSKEIAQIAVEINASLYNDSADSDLIGRVEG